MGHINERLEGLDRGNSAWSVGLLACLAVLPYVMYASLVGLVGLIAWQSYWQPKALYDLIHGRGFLLLGLLLLVSASFAVYPGEAWLQLAHFLPYFLVWGALVLHVRSLPDPWQQLSLWAWVLVLGSISLNLIAIAEYALKQGLLPGDLTTFPLLSWFYTGEVQNPRAFSVFDYPNTFANYGVMVAGLNVGLLLTGRHHSLRWLGEGQRKTAVLLFGLVLTALGLYCSGSRNGYIVFAAVLLAGVALMRGRRWVKGFALVSLGAIAASTFRFGIGGRRPTWAWVTDDPRVGVWQLALKMAHDSPILGCGLGNYKLLYDGSVPGYTFIAHAHNLWLMLAAEAGLPFAFGLTFAIGLICYRGVRGLMSRSLPAQHRELILGYTLCFAASMLFCLFDVTLFDARVNLLGWLCLAVLYIVPDITEAIPGGSN